jgi:hypothetical protein
MGYTVWDIIKGGPANRTRYMTKSRADAACSKLNAKHEIPNRFYVKPL